MHPFYIINVSNMYKAKYGGENGRIIRYSPGKEAEIFILVIKGTVEEEWLRRSSGVSSYITIDEEGLEKVLANQPYTPKKEKEVGMLFRF